MKSFNPDPISFDLFVTQSLDKNLSSRSSFAYVDHSTEYYLIVSTEHIRNALLFFLYTRHVHQFISSWLMKPSSLLPKTEGKAQKQHHRRPLAILDAEVHLLSNPDLWSFWAAS